MLKFSAVIIMSASLCACSAVNKADTNKSNTIYESTISESESKEVVTTESTVSEMKVATISQSSKNEVTQETDEPSFKSTFQAYVSERLPPFTFDVRTEEDPAGDEFFGHKYIIEISCPELSDYIPQRLEIRTGNFWNDPLNELIKLEDIDFDGYADMRVFKGMGMVNMVYDFYRFNYREFEEKPFFSLGTIGYTLYPETKQIISSARDNAVNHPRVMYQLETFRNNPSEYKIIREEYQEFVSRDSDVITAHILFEDEEIHNWNWGEYEKNEVAVADNYMRFGVANPIDLETATALLYDEYSEKDSKTGNKFDFIFKEMIVYEKMSCYKFQMKRLVENNHYSDVGFIAVTPNGEIIHDTGFET